MRSAEHNCWLDHCPVSGRHDPAPVPAVVWGDRVEREGPTELSERSARSVRVIAPEELLRAGSGVVAA